MHLLQPQPEVTTSLLVGTHSTLSPVLAPDQVQRSSWQNLTTEPEQVDWLILHFNHWFSHHNVILVKGDFEPEYFPATAEQPARIQFAHGFFNSALHEISHWSISGEKRRLLPDLGYWYAPDGRSAEQQALFEQVEIKPQAIEWLFATAFGRKFRVSLDNLTGDCGNGQKFKDNVFAQVQRYFSGEAKLPHDAAHFIHYICLCTRQGMPLQLDEFKREYLD
ncbi:MULTISPECIES: elongation factor P hydroxylase [unclassified Acinetobacter]|uniref:elongation factor P hydroxylase n=1 Tax=unclassified Acinetobacter TaxID=196816 RepID=UPI00244978C8|nr:MULTISPECIES: elongation factor P hydroxylase [unclassified Acinetobacter]MDH0030773.1 elongation factor P hydroxylase [Acinetobacter sp. GD04021]MDH0886454.1 elongation factor P hydroxylase [Acinetobacter sp. GD03873]MDH1082796.1 elongation factor P hydroxylase [Acinetobacter sp. GD03983]MDH2189822.1 elongation factor P hydroxylase [Acinetobacter sp. GD03645]MDH2202975.1 elongation factor P hydroxylase [Acinetobacter sp. GD03647]